MRRIAPATVAVLLALSATPVLASDAETTEQMTDEATPQRVEVPEVGLAYEFPADWSVRTPLGQRVSEIQRPDGRPVYVTTAIMARATDGSWCDTDVYLDMPAPLEEHAAAYAIYLQQIHGDDIPVFVSEIELPAGAAFYLEVADPARERTWAKYLFDGPVGETGSVDRFLMTCVAPIDAEPFWQPIAESAEVSLPVEPEASAAPEA